MARARIIRRKNPRTGQTVVIECISTRKPPCRIIRVEGKSKGSRKRRSSRKTKVITPTEAKRICRRAERKGYYWLYTNDSKGNLVLKIYRDPGLSELVERYIVRSKR